jgi:hypothetical protein
MLPVLAVLALAGPGVLIACGGSPTIATPTPTPTPKEAPPPEEPSATTLTNIAVTPACGSTVSISPYDRPVTVSGWYTIGPADKADTYVVTALYSVDGVNVSGGSATEAPYTELSGPFTTKPLRAIGDTATESHFLVMRIYKRLNGADPVQILEARTECKFRFK